MIMHSSSDNTEVPTSETLATIESSTLLENCEKSEEKQKPKLPDEALSTLPTASRRPNFTEEALSLREKEEFIQVRKKMVEETSHFETAQSIESSYSFYGRIEWLALSSIIAERREKERQTPKPKRKRHSSGHSESANSDSGGESDRTAIVLNHSGDLDYHPSGAHESSSDCEASETVDSDSLSGVGRRGRPKKKARSGNNPRSVSILKVSGAVAEPGPSGSEAPSSRILGSRTRVMTISVRNEGDNLGGAEYGPIASEVHAAAPCPASEESALTLRPQSRPMLSTEDPEVGLHLRVRRDETYYVYASPIFLEHFSDGAASWGVMMLGDLVASFQRPLPIAVNSL
ncbi:hypothetical protein C8Q78DRAFT_992925 [Trametes maxima]|nr:hypothetical protein C8Q78DRAFT_992925 [Trametes maxima]